MGEKVWAWSSKVISSSDHGAFVYLPGTLEIPSVICVMSDLHSQWWRWVSAGGQFLMLDYQRKFWWEIPYSLPTTSHQASANARITLIACRSEVLYRAPAFPNENWRNSSAGRRIEITKQDTQRPCLLATIADSQMIPTIWLCSSHCVVGCRVFGVQKR